MKKKAIIKKISAVLLLGIFMLAITPRKTVHDWFVHHKDSRPQQQNLPFQQISKPVFSCVCDDLVAESSFEAAASFFIHIHPQYPACRDQVISKSYFAPVFFSTLRGPPLKFQS